MKLYVNKNGRQPVQGHILSRLQEDGQDIDAEIAAKMELYAKHGRALTAEEARQEIVADFAGQKLFSSEADVMRLVRSDMNLGQKIHAYIRDMITMVKGTDAEKFLVRAERLYRKALKEADSQSDSRNGQYSFEGYHEDGRGKYLSNFAEGTIRTEKGERVKEYVENVWSKKPIELIIDENGIKRKINAIFDPYMDSDPKNPTDLTKLMNGTRHGNATEKKVTLNLADDYYHLLEDAEYDYSKPEVGKNFGPHIGVKTWHYFINDIYYAAQGSNTYKPYRISVNIKEKSDGHFVYSFSAQKQEGADIPRTLHAAGSDSGIAAVTNIHPSSDTNISQEKNGVKDSVRGGKPKYSVSGGGGDQKNIDLRVLLGGNKKANDSDIRPMQQSQQAKASAPIASAAKNDILKTFNISGALTSKNDPNYTRRDAFAWQYYEQVRNRKKNFEVQAVAKNTGLSLEAVSKAYDHIFINEYDLDAGKSRFYPSYDMAQSWQRLRDGKNIQPHDLIMLKHEALEYDLMNQGGLHYDEAHEKTNRLYNYNRELIKYRRENDL